MTNEELSKALQALAEEFGAEYSVTSSDDDGFMHRIKIGDTTACVSYYSVITWYVGAGLLDSSGRRLDSAGALPAEHAETILAWVRAKLLELTREERVKRFDELMDEMLSAYEVFAAELHGPTEFGLSERMSRLVDVKRLELRKLAFRGER